MSELQTCGKGLAARAGLPAGLADLIQGMVQILGFHQQSIDVTDPAGKDEVQVYADLEAQYRLVGALLKAAAGAMTAAYDLPMAAHDMRVLARRENAEIFATFVDGERAVRDYLEGAIREDEGMLRQMQALTRGA
jgi:hypothetical protein